MSERLLGRSVIPSVPELLSVERAELKIVLVKDGWTNKPKAEVRTIRHGTVVLGLDIVAVIHHTVPEKHTCEWCEDLKTRCLSRRGLRF